MDKIEFVEDIKGSLHLEHDHGERFRGWYLTETFERYDKLPLNNPDTIYNFRIHDYRFRFVMPSKIEFNGGMVSYSAAERELGVFRFPRDEEGNFCNPIAISEKANNEPLRFTEEQIKEILKRKSPLTFEAFRIPQYGFQFISVDNKDIKAILKLTDDNYVSQFREEYETNLNAKIEEVKNKVTSSPNYLLILENVLKRYWKNLNEVAFATQNIIHA